MRRSVSYLAGARLLPAILTTVSLLCVFLLPAVAGELPVPIEGKMLVSGANDQGDPYAYFIEEASDNVIPAPVAFTQGDLSPLADEVIYDVVAGEFPIFLKEIWKAGADGSDAVDLTGPGGANLGGINCRGFWSPDGSQIAFHHCDPVEGLLPCEAGWEVWAMNADGSEAYQMSPEGSPTTMVCAWAPNGYRLLLDIWYTGYATIDVDGSDLEFLPNVAAEGDWSPDGAKIVSCERVRGSLGGEPGWRRQLRLTNADGSDLQILVEHFVADSDAEQHLLSHGIEPDVWNRDMLAWSVGPTWAQFSPLGDRVAFIAAGLGASTPSFDPQGVYYALQNEIWIYELETGDLTRITDDLNYDFATSWKGDNTFPEDPEVTVDNTTVTFSAVGEGGGLTTIIRDDDPPALPADYQFCGEYYNIDTTADYTPPITICMTYEDGDVPGGNEAALCLLHYNESTEQYEDITTSKDTEANIVCGEVDSLSVFGLSVMPIFGGFRPPINGDGTSEWKAGRTIPVKFAIADSLGGPITNAICHLSVAGPLPEAVGEGVLETAEAASADVGDTFRYDAEEGQYIYNLSTKGWEAGAYMLEVSVEGWPGFTPSVRIGLR